MSEIQQMHVTDLELVLHDLHVPTNRRSVLVEFLNCCQAKRACPWAHSKNDTNLGIFAKLDNANPIQHVPSSAAQIS